MRVLPIHPDIITYVLARNLYSRFIKQLALFVENEHHPSLHVELLEPKRMGIYSMRINKKYRVLFIYVAPGVVELIDANNHYE